MNYLAHLFLAKPTPDSYTGNLLGDFCRGVDTTIYSEPVLAGLKNHRLVDKFTDAHPLVRQAKQQFSPQYRRFAGIALDVLFDHFLIQYWTQYHHTDFELFCLQAYCRLEQRLPIMPSTMQQAVSSMIEHHWLSHYHNLQGVERALDNLARRIRFSNQFAGSIDDIVKNYAEFEQCFEQFFPQLMLHVQQSGAE